MACEAKNKKLGFLEGSLLLLTMKMMACVDGENNDEAPQVPCVFIFGDSLSDSGNNNELRTSAKVSHEPYGIDFPDGPTGRFTNGRTSIDIITELVGLKELIPPFAKIGGFDILKGVNYASGAAGIRIETGTQLGAVISLGLQLENHRKIVAEIVSRPGGFEKAQAHLNKCLYYFNIGSNDYINNYFLPQFYPTSLFFSLDHYAVDLILKYSDTLRGNCLLWKLHRHSQQTKVEENGYYAMHELGGRKFVLVGIGAIGCTPHAISTNENSCDGMLSCVDDMNKAALIFNSKLESLVDQFNHDLSHNSKFIFINSTVWMSIDPSSLGFKVSHAGCCKVGENGQCVANERACYNRNDYVFFDSFHPTEAANIITAISSYNASNPAFTYPMDIAHLLRS